MSAAKHPGWSGVAALLAHLEARGTTAHDWHVYAYRRALLQRVL